MSTNGERDGVNTSRLLAKRLRGWLAPGMSRRDGAIGGCRGGGPVKCAHLGPKPPPSDAILGRMSDSITVDVDGTEVKITHPDRSEEHTSELQSLMRISYAVFCLNKKKTSIYNKENKHKE